MAFDAVFRYRQSVDPGAVGPGVYWVDMSSEPYVLKLRTEANDDWIVVGGSGGGGGGAIETVADTNSVDLVLTGTELTAAVIDSYVLGIVADDLIDDFAAKADVTAIPELARDAIGAALASGTNITITVDDPGDTITITHSGNHDDRYYTESEIDTLLAAITPYTDEAVRDAIGTALTAGAGISISVDDPGNTITITSTITQYTDEQARDALGAALVAGSNVTITVNDALDTITVDATPGGGSYTDEQVRDVIGASLAVGAGITIVVDDDTDTITFGSSITQYTDEMARDALGTALVAGTNITITVNDAANTITIDATGGSSYTDENARDAIGTALTAGQSITLTVNDGADTIGVAVTAGIPIGIGGTGVSTGVGTLWGANAIVYTETISRFGSIDGETDSVRKFLSSKGSGGSTTAPTFQQVSQDLGTTYQLAPGPNVISIAGATALANQQIGARLLGVCPIDASGCVISVVVATAGATITWSEFALASAPTPTSGAMTTLSSQSMNAVVNTTGQKTVTFTVDIAAGTIVYFLFGSNASTRFQLRPTGSDDFATGTVRLASTVQPSTMAAGTSFASSSAATGPAAVFFRWTT